MSKPKIAMIGAGSVVFCKTLMSDIMATPELADSEFALMSRTEPKLRRMEAFAKRMLQENALPGTVWATLDRREAIRDADFVVVMIQVGGVDAFEVDYEIPLKYGVDQCIGDSLGPGGCSGACGSDPGAGRDRARHGGAWRSRAPSCCSTPTRWRPTAWPWARLPTFPFVGLCHGVQTTLDLIAGYCDVPKDEITYTCGGINHMDWFLTLRHRGRDLYPELRELFEKPEYYKNEKVRGEVFRHFGYFMTESTGHLSEYVPWFRKNRRRWISTATSRASAARPAPTTSTAKALAGQVRRARPAGIRVGADRTPQRRVLLVHHGGRGHRPAVPLHGQCPERRLHHQLSGRLLRRGADLRRRHRVCTRHASGRSRRSAPRPA